MSREPSFPPPTVPPPARARFELVIYVRQASHAVELVPGVMTVGRSADNGVRVDDPSVSRHHLRLYVGESVEAEDLGSANGTVLLRTNTASGEDGNDATGGSTAALGPGRRVRLSTGDVLRVGQVVLVLQAKGRSSLVPRAGGSPGPVVIHPEMKRAHDLLRRAAATEICVLLLGETGVGKEVLAETVHRYSMRSKLPFLKLNCAALTDSLLESELFGHERGAFTGAHGAKAGLLESTDGGTVFLDEIGELSPGTQAKLLRVLEERAVLRVGATKPRKIDVRFVTATNRDLAQRVQAGLFRSDLYYRISGLVVRIPPLRQRRVEIEPLARYFLQQFASRGGQPEPRLTRGALELLNAYDWPGNVRELRNAMERAVLLATQGVVEPDHVLLEAPPPPDELMDAVFDAETAVMEPLLSPEPGDPEDERSRVIRALEACGGNQTRAAQMLGVSRRTLINRIEEFNLPRPKKR
jgi:two-component system, NtrC family, response regulator AtoC